MREPSAALAFQYGKSSSSDPHATGYGWAALDRSGTEHYLNVPFVPQTGWPVPDNTNGLAFDMFVHSDPWDGIGVAYVLEYTLPTPGCDTDLAWDTYVSIRLPHGLCVADEGNVTQCSSDDQVRADFQMFAVNDPTGTMSVTGSGRPALEQAITTALRTIDNHSRLYIEGNTQSEQRKSAHLQGNFYIGQGASAHVYVGVGAGLMKFRQGWMCLYKCYTQPSDQVKDHAVFLVTGGTDGIISFATTKRP